MNLISSESVYTISEPMYVFCGNSVCKRRNVPSLRSLVVDGERMMVGISAWFLFSA